MNESWQGQRFAGFVGCGPLLTPIVTLPRRGPGGAIRGCQQGHKCHPTLPYQEISVICRSWRGGNNMLKLILRYRMNCIF